ncbi:putative calreticulin/calnexin [Helianthus debilis subsp. tardiflorus]
MIGRVWGQILKKITPTTHGLIDLLLNCSEFEDDPDLYVLKPIKYVGIEVWQVKAGSVFDNVLICDDPEYAKEVVLEVFTHREVCFFFCITTRGDF